MDWRRDTWRFGPSFQNWKNSDAGRITRRIPKLLFYKEVVILILPSSIISIMIYIKVDTHKAAEPQ